MGNFKYTYNVEEFGKFFNARLLPMLQSLSDKRIFPLPWLKKAAAKEAFETTCNTLGRFTPYEAKLTENTYQFYKDLRLFPDFYSIKYNGCFTGISAGKTFDAKSVELYKHDGKSNKRVWNGMLVSTQYIQKTFGRVLFKKRGILSNNVSAVKIIFSKKKYEDIIEKTVLKKGENYCEVIAKNYYITFTNKQDQQNFSNEDLCKKLCTIIKKYNCNISFTILNNNLFIALSGLENHSSYTENGWLDFNNDFTDEDFMKDIFQQFETVVMALKLLNS